MAIRKSADRIPYAPKPPPDGAARLVSGEWLAIAAILAAVPAA